MKAFQVGDYAKVAESRGYSGSIAERWIDVNIPRLKRYWYNHNFYPDLNVRGTIMKIAPIWIEGEADIAVFFLSDNGLGYVINPARLEKVEVADDEF